MTATAARPAPARGPGLRVLDRAAGAAGFAPFGVYVALFLVVPAAFAVGSGFFDEAGHFTLGNFAALTDPSVQSAFFNSFWLSAVSAIISAVLGALICWALLAIAPDGITRIAVDSVASVLAQFGGVMLAFAWIATIGTGGTVQLLIQALTGVNINQNGTILYSVPGLLLPYIYFGVPLMVLTFMPSMAALKPQWGEAAATLGGTRRHYWIRIAGPVLLPGFLGAVILLFANAFSSFATAAAIIAQGGLVPLIIQQQLTSETIVGVANVAGVLALGMVVIIAALMVVYGLLERRASRWRS